MSIGLKQLMFAMLSTQKRFERIYKHNYWGCDESVSGFGSTLAGTEHLRQRLPSLIDELEIRSILDVPCGDFNWMQHVLRERPDVDYTGFDIVPSLIKKMQAKYSKATVRFAHRDAITDDLPRVDLILNRDFLIHMSFRDAAAVMSNIRRSRSTWLLANTYRGINKNEDITTGRWRFVNLLLPPYNFPAPALTIEEHAGEGKLIGLWKIANLPGA
jgi:SAM-dependent methyltransferase